MKKSIIAVSILSALLGIKAFAAMPSNDIFNVISNDPPDCSALQGKAFCDCFRTETEGECLKVQMIPARLCKPMQNLINEEILFAGSVQKACEQGCKMDKVSDLPGCISRCVTETTRYKDNTQQDNCPLNE